MNKHRIIFGLACVVAFTVICITLNRQQTPTIDDSAWVDVDSIDVQADNAAMSSSHHMKFVDVPIDGTLRQYVSRMRRAGFKVERYDGSVAVLVGTFLGYGGTRVYVNTLGKRDLVSKIAVVLPSMDDWSDLETAYTELKDYMTRGFGGYKSCVERFDNPYAQKDTGKMHAILLDQFKYETRFISESGDLSLLIKHADQKTFVMLIYKDKENIQLLRMDAMDDL